VKDNVSINGYRAGEWADLPDFLTVKVIAVSSMRKNTPNGITSTLSGRVTNFKTLLYSNTLKPELSSVYSDKEKAVQQAKHLAASLKADLILYIPGKG
jgi:hypothetical protein